uniref:HK97-gp10 family putative phage morphogenesis protein n=1 Tax=Jeotgalibaca porci TaxID=1868793 RepID=UPI0035A0416A
MAKNFTFIDNSKQVKAALRKVSGQALEEAALLVEGQAKALAPVDSGELRDKIDHTIKEQNGMKIAQIGSPLDYAIYVEYGTGEHTTNGAGRKGGWRYQAPDGTWHFTRGMKAQPFLLPAFRRNKKNIEKVIGVKLSSTFNGK